MHSSSEDNYDKYKCPYKCCEDEFREFESLNKLQQKAFKSALIACMEGPICNTPDKVLQVADIYNAVAIYPAAGNDIQNVRYPAAGNYTQNTRYPAAGNDIQNVRYPAAGNYTQNTRYPAAGNYTQNTRYPVARKDTENARYRTAENEFYKLLYPAASLNLKYVGSSCDQLLTVIARQFPTLACELRAFDVLL